MPVQLNTRPDGRTIVSLRDAPPADVPELLAAAQRQTDGPLFAHIDLAVAGLFSSCQAAGFVAEVVSARYDVPFAPFLSQRHHCSASSRFRLVPADEVDQTLLFWLDQELRQDVPGTDGWVAGRALFDQEMSSAEFDPTGYVVAQHLDSGELVGLIRFWRNDATPNLGLLGVVADRRSGFLAHDLLQAGLTAASRWGSPTFTTHTARSALQRRLVTNGAVCTGRFAQMVHRG